MRLINKNLISSSLYKIKVCEDLSKAGELGHEDAYMFLESYCK